MGHNEMGDAPKALRDFVLYYLADCDCNNQFLTNAYHSHFMQEWQAWSIIKKGESLRRRLDWMHQHGYITKTKVKELGHADLFIYSLTQAGRDLAEAVLEKPKPQPKRSFWR